MGQNPIIVDLSQVRIDEMTNLPTKAEFGPEDRKATVAERKPEQYTTNTAPQPEPKPQIEETKPEPIPEPEPPQRTVVIHPEGAQQQIEEIIDQVPVEPGYYQVSMTTDWYFPDGASPSTNAFVRNRENNSNDVYFDILLRDSRETIYESPIIPLGNYIDNITLDKDLDAGVYNCLIVYHLVDENQTTLSTLNMGLTITVNN